MDPDLRDLLAAWRGDPVSDEPRQQEILARLRTDPDLRRAFVAEIRMLGMLKAVQSAEPRWLLLADAVGRSGGGPVGAGALAERVVREGRARARGRRFGRRLALAASVAAAVAGLLALPWGGRTLAGVVVDVARVSRAEAVEWPPGEAATPEGGVVGTGQHRIRSGRLTLTYPSGVVMAVEGPADLELSGPDEVFLHHGKLRVRVPAGANGFTARADGYEVVDLGAEFGMNRTPDGTLRVRVFDGEVALSRLGAGELPVQCALIDRTRGIAVDPGGDGIRADATPADHFARIPNLPPPPLHLAAGYREKILAAGPWGYWRFDRLAGGRVENEVAGRPALLARGGVRVDTAAGRNGWAVFPPGDPSQLLRSADPWTPSRAGGYTVELWFAPDTFGPDLPGQAALVALMAKEEPQEASDERCLSLLELSAFGRQSPNAPCAVRFLDRWPPGSRGGANLFTRRVVVPTRWHHLVGRKDGDILELYVDGELAGKSPAREDGVRETTPCWLLVGRLKERTPPADLPEVRPFVGQLDELAVYDRPLTADEIRGHFRMAVRTFRPPSP